MSDLAVQTHGLTKRFGSVTALDGLVLSIPAGAIFGVIGPNGAGKTTLMRLLLDVLRPTSGRVEVLGQDPRAGGAALRSRIGYLPGELRLESRLPGQSMLEYWGRLGGPVDMGYAGKLAERLGLDLTRPADKLSKGNKQKLGLVQAFMHRPDLLVLDEPTSGLDPLVQQEFVELTREARDDGATVFLSSHVLSEVEELADTAAVLRRGQVVREASVHELRSSAARHLHALLDADEAALRSALAERGLGALSVQPAAVDRLSVSGLVEGRADELVKALSGFHVVDLTLAEPDLEESVLHLYEEAAQ
ncbi:MAG: ABC transporter ATP-binding protein [Dermatophilaceae bacterium]